MLVDARHIADAFGNSKGISNGLAPVKLATRTWRSMPAGLARFRSSTAFSSSARDKSACSPSLSPLMFPFASLKPQLALLAFTESPKPGMLLLMLFLLARNSLSDGRRPPVSVADSCARMLSICDHAIQSRTREGDFFIFLCNMSNKKDATGLMI